MNAKIVVNAECDSSPQLCTWWRISKIQNVWKVGKTDVLTTCNSNTLDYVKPRDQTSQCNRDDLTELKVSETVSKYSSLTKLHIVHKRLELGLGLGNKPLIHFFALFFFLLLLLLSGLIFYLCTYY